MPLGLQNAYMAEGVQSALRQRIADQIAEEERQRRALIEGRTANRADRELDIREKERADTLAAQKALQTSLIEQRRNQAADVSAENIGMGQSIPAEDFQQSFAGTPTASMFTPQETLPAKQMAGMLRLATPEAPAASEAITRAAPRALTGRMVSSGTGAQHKQVAEASLKRELATQTAAEKAEQAQLNRDAKVESDARNADLRRDLAVVAGANKGKMSAGQQYQATNKLQRDYEKIRVPIREMDRQLRLMQSGLEQAKAGNMNAGSQEVLVTFQKILDPASVVRESEYARSPQGQAYINRIKGFVDRATKGGPGVTLPELQGFVKAAEDMVSSMKGFTGSKRKQLEKTAAAFDLDPSLLFDDDDIADTPAAAASPSSAQPAAAPPRKRYDMNGNPL